MKRITAPFSKYISIAVFLLVWETVSRLKLVNPLFIPPVTKVLGKTWEMLMDGVLLKHMEISIFRAFLGFLIAMVIGIPLGFLLGGWFKRLQLALGPLLEFFSQTNPFILFHLIMLFLGIGEATKVSIIAWVCIWPIIFSTISGIQNTNPYLLKAARGFGLNRLSLFYKIVLPSAGPAIFVGLRLSAGYSFFMLIAAEMMGSSSGLGWLILNSQENYDILRIFASATVIALLGLGVDLLMGLAEKKIIRVGFEEFLNSEY
ncbi:ABC transporter permease [Syntrophobotulus glycolicus]|nr:ABC transporter permease [Syntrophobotulus glycolicus]